MPSPHISRLNSSFRLCKSTAAVSSLPNSLTVLMPWSASTSLSPKATPKRAVWRRQQMSFVNLFRGARGLSQPPIDDIESYWSLSEKAQAARMLARSIIGSPETVRSGIEALVAETGADELIVVSDVYDHTARLRFSSSSPTLPESNDNMFRHRP